MKIGVNVKKIYENVYAFLEERFMSLGTTLNNLSEQISNNSNTLNSHETSISSHETRITTLEDSGLQLETYTLQLFNPDNTKISDIFCKKLDETVFLHFYYYKTLSNIDRGMIGYNYVQLGTFTLGNSNDNDMFHCKGYIPCHYKLGTFDSYAHNGLLNIYIENNENVIYLIIDKDDIELWQNISNLDTYIEIRGSGIMNASEIIA